ncbi:hypothetical protein MM440_12300 [Arsenicicoccus piscis]|uniref:Uncharacterized protein n=1 Tax=Arsenicicoccus piscis TaxID=673954 RepID=A0ABQ6HP27_9MICO|nr:hypothetical protein [Arsenicicoccus piscis]MCH8628526.1 hypothetical protein [Arsenicicoccus piscis]GMA19895.1 hypothetical protein GCM10025862_19160 [Arsenicicoccus piscis]
MTTASTTMPLPTVPSLALRGAPPETRVLAGITSGPLALLLDADEDTRRARAALVNAGDALNRADPNSNRLETEVQRLLTLNDEGNLTTTDLDEAAHTVVIARDALSTRDNLEQLLAHRLQGTFTSAAQQVTANAYSSLTTQLHAVVDRYQALNVSRYRDAEDALTAGDGDAWRESTGLAGKYGQLREAQALLDALHTTPQWDSGTWCLVGRIAGATKVWDQVGPWVAAVKGAHVARQVDGMTVTGPGTNPPWPDPRHGSHRQWLTWLADNPAATPWIPSPRQRNTEAETIAAAAVDWRDKTHPRVEPPISAGTRALLDRANRNLM